MTQVSVLALSLLGDIDSDVPILLPISNFDVFKSLQNIIVSLLRAIIALRDDIS